MTPHRWRRTISRTATLALGLVLTSCLDQDCSADTRAITLEGLAVDGSDQPLADVLLSLTEVQSSSGILYLRISHHAAATQPNPLVGHMVDAQVRDADGNLLYDLTLQFPTDGTSLAFVSLGLVASEGEALRAALAEGGALWLTTDIAGSETLTVPVTVTAGSNWHKGSCSLVGS